MRKHILIGLMFIAPALLSLSAQAAGFSNPPISNSMEGKKIAQTECVNCHVIENVRDKSPKPRAPGAAPYFRAIAFDPNMTPDKIRETLKLPHGEMANILLTDKDIDSVISYIESMHHP